MKTLIKLILLFMIIGCEKETNKPIADFDFFDGDLYQNEVIKFDNTSKNYDNCIWTIEFVGNVHTAVFDEFEYNDTDSNHNLYYTFKRHNTYYQTQYEYYDITLKVFNINNEYDKIKKRIFINKELD